MDRNEFVYRDIDKSTKILEFAPYFNPLFPKSEGYQTEIVDAFEKDELLNRASEDPNIDDYSKIENVDYVCHNEYARHIGKLSAYDLIVASHMIEHVIDIVGFLEDCSKLLKDDGIIRLIIPDRRNTFDYFRDTVSTRLAIDTHLYYRGDFHTFGTLMENRLRTCRAYPGSSFIPNSSFIYDDMLFLENRDFLKKRESLIDKIDRYSSKYIDTHSWCITPKTFEILIYELNLLGFIDLVVSVISSNRHSMEFYVDLRKGEIKEDDPDKRLELYKQRKYEEWEEFEIAEEVARLKKKITGTPDLKIYIYGTGKGSANVIKMLEQLKIGFDGFVVSDGFREGLFFEGKSVAELSELEYRQNLAVVISVIKDREKVVQNLESRNIDYYYF